MKENKLKNIYIIIIISIKKMDLQKDNIRVEKITEELINTYGCIKDIETLKHRIREMLYLFDLELVDMLPLKTYNLNLCDTEN